MALTSNPKTSLQSLSLNGNSIEDRGGWFWFKFWKMFCKWAWYFVLPLVIRGLCVGYQLWLKCCTFVGGAVASWLVSLSPDRALREPGPGQRHCVLGQDTSWLSQCLSTPRCINRYWQFVGKTYQMAGEWPGMDQHPSRETRNTLHSHRNR